MILKMESYQTSLERLPKSGQQIIGHQSAEHIVVYQAYKPSIAAHAVMDQKLGGPDFSYSRMSWIKPNFLWMMYRCGWASKENQERVLAIWINKAHFDYILTESVHSSYKQRVYSSKELWQQELTNKKVRLQWDPDHDPFGQKIERRAIQLGLKDQTLKEFGKNQIEKIEDITDFVLEQNEHVKNQSLEKLQVPIETIYTPSDNSLIHKLGISR